VFQYLQYVLTKSGYVIFDNIPDDVIVNPEITVD